jgi:hypothetical protein
MEIPSVTAMLGVFTLAVSVAKLAGVTNPLGRLVVEMIVLPELPGTNEVVAAASPALMVTDAGEIVPAAVFELTTLNVTGGAPETGATCCSCEY